MTRRVRWVVWTTLVVLTLAATALLLVAVGCGSGNDGDDELTISTNAFDQSVALYPVTTPGGRMGYIDNTGKLVIAARFIEADPFSGGLAAVRPEVNGLWGYIDVTGQSAIESQFADASEFSEGLAAVRVDVNGSWGYVSLDGAIHIPPQFASAGRFSEGLARVRVDQESGYIDTAGEWVVRMSLREAVSGFSGGLALVFDRTADLYGCVDRDGGLAIAPAYADAWGFSEDVAPVRLPDSDQYGYIDRGGGWVIQPQFVDARPFSEGVAAVRWAATGGWGYVDATGAELIPAQWDLAEPFDGGVARVGLIVGDADGGGTLLWGFAYIDLGGNVLWRDEDYARFTSDTEAGADDAAGAGAEAIISAP